VTSVPEEWLSRGGNPAIQNPAYRLADTKTEKARRENRRAFAILNPIEPALRSAKLHPAKGYPLNCNAVAARFPCADDFFVRDILKELLWLRFI
jgi:hypothetical protein